MNAYNAPRLPGGCMKLNRITITSPTRHFAGGLRRFSASGITDR
ncbi:hypothetical protein EJP617_15410 [Erwinia sp. Ejp617]|nr:hypothetical protein EJP617_15410 [Erwinia sp. Ejp617]